MPTTSQLGTTTIKTTSEDIDPVIHKKIKQTIFVKHIKQRPTTTEPETPTGPELEEYDPNKLSFISEFNDTTSMFSYINTINSAITAETGITRSQLIALTQNDDWEDANYDFFGTLNRLFGDIDADGNGKLSFEELKAYIGDEIGEYSDFDTKVETYSAILQNAYASLGTYQEKLEFVIERTKEYLEAAGLTEQLEVLEMLLNEDDTANTDYYAKCGQIVITDLNPTFSRSSTSYTLGAYSYSTYGQINADGEWESYNIDGYEYAVWASDTDSEDSDLGLTLDFSIFDNTSRFGSVQDWCVAVDTLVHELTHATAKLYYSEALIYLPGYENVYRAYCPNERALDKLVSIGAITQEQKDEYWSTFQTTHKFPEEILYMVSCLWGEYSAYQTDADYLDSVAGDIYNSYESTAVDGVDERTAIEEHINSLYNPSSYGYDEAIPTWKWWSYV